MAKDSANPWSERYDDFLKSVGRERAIWIAESMEFVLTAIDEDGRELLPVWPSASAVLASLSPERKAEGFRAVSRSLEEWKRKTTPSLIETGVLVGIFPDEDMACPALPIADVNRDLDRALRQAGAAQVLQGADLARLGRKRAKRMR